MPFLQKVLSVILLTFTISLTAQAKTQATASVNSTKITVGDILTLTVEVNDRGSEYRLDTSKLVNNFMVYRPSRSEGTFNENGTVTKQTTWSLRLQAKETGSFTIPAFELGDATTVPINIDVSESSDKAASTNNNTIFIKNTADKSTVYMGQKILVESKLYFLGNIEASQFQKPILKEAAIEELERREQRPEVINGMQYKVFSFKYEMTPSLAGDLNISFSPLVGTNHSQNRRTSKAINIAGNDIAITIKPIPANFQGDWLVSEDVRLIENNDLQQQTHFVGDPITRSISLLVASLPIDKMPEVKFNYSNSLRFYPDQDDFKQGTINELIYSQRTMTHAIIPSQSGELVLPEIKIAWWNSTTDKQEFATLPTQTLTIKPALQDDNQPALTPTLPHIENNNNKHTEENSEQLLAWQISTFILLILLILLSFYHLQQNRTSIVETNSKKDTEPNNKQYQHLLKALQEAQKNNVYLCLLRYFQLQQPTLTQLQQVALFTGLNEDKKQALLHNLQQLELACSAETHQWDAKNLLILIKMHHQETKKSNADVINNINP